MSAEFDVAVRDLAGAHTRVVGNDLQVFVVPSPSEDEIWLLEVSDEFIPMGEVWPITFGKDTDVPFRTTIIQLTHDEWQKVQQHDPAMTLPAGWRIDDMQPVKRD